MPIKPDTCKYCNTYSNNISDHMKRCKNYINDMNKYINSLNIFEKEVIDQYINNELSIDELGAWCNEKFYTNQNAHYKLLKPWLSERGIYRGNSITTKRRTKKIQETTLQNHGTLVVSHYRIDSNKIIYKKVPYLDIGYKKYYDAVTKETKKSLKEKEIKQYCEYTGIKFGDANGEMINPNDPVKRSVDHKIPIIWGYLNNIPINIIGGKENLAYVLKYVNTVKGNTLYESFIPLAIKIRKIFKDEGYESR